MATPPNPSTEVQSTVTLLDFYRAWARYRALYLIGLILVAGFTFVFAKFVMTKFYRADTSFFIGSKFTPESMVGVADTELFEGTRNEKYLDIRQGEIAQRYLASRELLLGVVNELKAEEDIDLYEMLNIRETDETLRKAQLVKYLNDDLIRTIQNQSSGLLVLSVEMPDPEVAAMFANKSIEKLREEFTRLDFQYFEEALKLYEQKFQDELARRDALAAELTKMNLGAGYFDKYEKKEQQRQALLEELEFQAETLAELSKRIEELRLATSEEAKQAAQPVKVIERAYPPLKKSRPKTILSTVVAAALYTFVFMLGLALASLIRLSGQSVQTRGLEAPAMPPQSPEGIQ